MKRQLEFWPSDGPLYRGEAFSCNQADAPSAIRTLISDEHSYVSLKRVLLIRDGRLHSRPCVTSTDEAKQFFAEYWREYPGNDQERFVVACLDTKHRVHCVVTVTVGTLDSSLIHPREVFKAAIFEGASAILLSHNHPSGNGRASEEDLDVTKRLTEAGELLASRCWTISFLVMAQTRWFRFASGWQME